MFRFVIVEPLIDEGDDRFSLWSRPRSFLSTRGFSEHVRVSGLFFVCIFRWSLRGGESTLGSMELFAVGLVATLFLAIGANGFGMARLPLVGEKFLVIRFASE